VEGEYLENKISFKRTVMTKLSETNMEK